MLSYPRARIAFNANEHSSTTVVDALFHSLCSEARGNRRLNHSFFSEPQNQALTTSRSKTAFALDATHD